MIYRHFNMFFLSQINISKELLSHRDHLSN